MVRACLVDVYDTILESHFVSRMESLIAPLGIAIGDWLAEWDKMREDRDRGKVTMAASFAATLSALGLEPEPGLVADLSRRDVELGAAFTRLCADTVPFLEWLRSNGVLTAQSVGAFTVLVTPVGTVPPYAGIVPNAAVTDAPPELASDSPLASVCIAKLREPATVKVTAMLPETEAADARPRP